MLQLTPSFSQLMASRPQASRLLPSIVLILSAFNTGWPTFSHATEESDLPKNLIEFTSKGRLPISARERFLRTEAILREFQVPEETPQASLLRSLENRQTLSGLHQVLPSLDRSGAWQKFFRIGGTSESSMIWKSFRDPESQERLSFEIPLLGPAEVIRPNAHTQRLQTIASQANSSLPLRGLRVALDPGHMGGDFWDHETGKYVEDERGRKLSEGLLALQTALLLEQELRALGAEVSLTRRSLSAVTPTPYRELDLRAWGLRELRESQLLDWFQDLLTRAPIGADLFRTFERSPRVRNLFDASQRGKYFILREDLIARSTQMSAFSPDISLVLHFDTSDPPGNPHGLNRADHNGTKTYISGAFQPEEFASQESRELFTAHLLDRDARESSLRLSRAVVQAISTRLQLGLETFGGREATPVEPGIFARNLGVSRRLTGHAVSYVECLFYNGPTEFERLQQQTETLEVDGQPTRFSPRLRQLSTALKEAILTTVASYR